MTVLHVHKKQKDFLILDKSCLNQENLSWGAKGLHSYLMSLPDDWQIKVCDLQKSSTNGRDAVRSLLNELEDAGYIKKATKRNKENGRFGGLEFLVLENPNQDLDSDLAENKKEPLVSFSALKPETENPLTDFPKTDNPTLPSDVKKLFNINNKTNNKSERIEIENLKQPISQNFYPSQETISRAIAAGYNNATDPNIIQEFIDKNTAWGSTFADFNPIYLVFLAKHAERKQKQSLIPTTHHHRSKNNERASSKISSYDAALEEVRRNNQSACNPSTDELFPSPKEGTCGLEHEPRFLALGGTNKNLWGSIPY